MLNGRVAADRAAAPVDRVAAHRHRARARARDHLPAERVRRTRAQAARLGGRRAGRAVGPTTRAAALAAGGGAGDDACGGDRRRPVVRGFLLPGPLIALYTV